MFITIPGDSLWRVYTEDKAPQGLYRGGGTATTPNTFKKDGGKERPRRPIDFRIVFDPATNKEMVFPDPTRGLSFSSTVDRLKGIGIRGTVWRLPREARLPKGLVVNYNDITHPLINVAYKMTVDDLIGFLKELESLMEKTGVIIK
jgi:hypothetical protein